MDKPENYEHIYKFLRDGALSDARHDFAPSDDKYAVVKKGLIEDNTYEDYPLTPKMEDTFLNMLFSNTSFDAIRHDIKNAPDSQIDLNESNILQHKYTVKLLKKNNVSDINKFIGEKSLTINDIRDFFKSDIINLLIDSSSIKIMELISSLKTEENDKELFINLIFNRESINDPAGKITNFKKIDPIVANKLKTDVLIDRGVSDILYMKSDPNLNKTPLQRDKFFSKYDFNIAPVMYRQNRLNSIKSKFVSTKVDVLNNSELVYPITDNKINNTIAKCWQMILCYFKDNNHLLASILFQAKRSGDWLQALSCLDTKRNYGSKSTGKIDDIKGVITLVTHDRILLAYSLYLGIDVLFTNINNDEKNIFYFYNNMNESRKDSKELDEYLKGVTEVLRKKREAEHKAIIEATQTYITKDIEESFNFIDKYMGWVNEIKEVRREKVINALAKPMPYDTNEYFKVLWEFASIKYHNFDKSKELIQNLRAEYEKDTSNIDICNKILSFKTDFDIEKDVNKSTIERSSNHYKKEAGYNIMDSPKTRMKGRELEKSQQRLIVMIDFFSKSLPPDLFKEFKKTCMEWSDTLSNESEYMIHSLALLLKAVTPVSDSPDEIIEEEVVSLKESDVEIIAGLTNYLVPKGGIVSTGLQILGGLSQLMLDYADMKGGARIIDDNLESVCYSFLINIYLSNLYFNLSQIDSEDNFDYVYYKTLVEYIRKCFNKFRDSFNRVKILYKTLTSDPLVPDSTRFLAEQICIDSIGYESSNITKIVGINIGDIDSEMNDNNMNFSESKEDMLKYLQKEFEVIALVDNKGKLIQKLKSMKRQKNNKVNNEGNNSLIGYHSPTRKKHRGQINTPPRSTSPVH